VALEDPAGRSRRRRLATAAPRRQAERWPLRRHSQSCRRFGVLRETGWAADRPPMARTGFPPTPGSQHRGSVGDHPRYGDKAACPPAPSDSLSLATHEGTRRPALYAGTSARLVVAPCAPFLPTFPIGGRPYAHRKRMPSSVLHTAAQPPSDRLRNGWTMTPGR
jgi:hypothetical protein